jgi:predicted MFS family arabinose efflux permease
LSIYAVGEKKEAAEFIETNKANRASKEISTRQAFNEIMRIKPLVSMIIIIFIYTFVIKGIYSYLGVLIGDYGGGPLSLGLTFFFDAAPEKYKASCMSLCETIIGLSGVISAPIFGFLFAEFGGNAAIATGLVIYIVSALAILWNFYQEKKVVNLSGLDA